MNATLYTRGCHADFDSWGVPGYTGSDLEPFFKRSQAHSHGLRTERADVYGYEGPWATRDMPQLFGFSKPFVEAAVLDFVRYEKEAEEAFGFVPRQRRATPYPST